MPLCSYATAQSQSMMATETIFGWTLTGVGDSNSNKHHSSSTCLKLSSTHESADNLLSRFWALEEVPGEDSTRKNVRVELAPPKYSAIIMICKGGNGTDKRFSMELYSRKPRARARLYLHWLRCSRQIYLDRQEHLYCFTFQEHLLHQSNSSLTEPHYDNLAPKNS